MFLQVLFQGEHPNSGDQEIFIFEGHPDSSIHLQVIFTNLKKKQFFPLSYLAVCHFGDDNLLGTRPEKLYAYGDICGQNQRKTSDTWTCCLPVSYAYEFSVEAMEIYSIQLMKSGL